MSKPLRQFPLKKQLVYGVVLVLIFLFFVAPVIPVTEMIHICGSLTDWQSPSYYLFGVGVHLSRYVPCS